MNDFQYTSREKAVMFDHWYHGRLSDDELKAYREAWHQNRRPAGKAKGQTNNKQEKQP